MNLSYVINRTKNIIISPKAEWKTIQLENRTKDFVVRQYALPLIALMAICCFVGSLIMVGNLAGAVVHCILTFIFTLIHLYISAYIINEITPSFNSKKNIHATFALVTYSFTAYFLVTAITLLLPLGLLQAFGLYSFYLFWEGTTVMVETPEDNKTGFVVVSAVIIVGIYSILRLIMNGINMSLTMAMFLGQK